MTRVCTKCGVEKEITEFRQPDKRKERREKRCMSCYNQKQRELYAARAARRGPAPLTSPTVAIVDGKKKCSKCGKMLPVSEFWRNKSIKCGLDSSCIPCTKAAKSPRVPKKPKPRRFPPFKGYGLPENRERAYHG